MNPELASPLPVETSERPKDYYPQLYKMSRFVLRSIYDVRIQGEENILDEPAIYAANHVKFADSLLMSMVHTEQTGEPMRFVVKKEYLEGKGINNKGRLGAPVKWFMEHTWQIPVDREAGDASSTLKMVREVKAAKKRGESTGIHPGGTRIDESEGLTRFNEGVGLAAVSADLAAVPVSIEYGERPHWYSKIPVLLQYGTPITPEEFPLLPDPESSDAEQKRLTSKEKIRRVTMALEERVATMLDIARTGTKAVLKKYLED